MSATATHRARQRLQQDAAADAITGDGPRCDATKQIGTRTWECIMPPHASGQPAVDSVRRRLGDSVHADRHVMRPVERTPDA